MRNLKRVLALALALVMTLGLLIIGSSAASYTDAAQIDDDYADAIEVLTGMGVFQGMEGNAFSPTTILTRAQAATLVYRVLTGDVTDAKVDLYDYKSFNDVPAGKWYTGYVTYAANGGYIKGWNGNFSPDDQVTGVQVLAIMLRAVGYGQNGEFEGAAWKDNTLTTANDLGLLKDIDVKSLDAPAQRQLVAQLLFNAITEANIVYYTPALGYYTGNVTNGLAKTTLGKKVFDLTNNGRQTVDNWGRPGVIWTYNTGDEKTTLVEDALATYTTKVSPCQITADANKGRNMSNLGVWVNANEMNYVYTVVATDEATKLGAQGRLTEVYSDRIVMIDTMLAQVTSVTPVTYDTAGHKINNATMTLKVYDVDTANTATTVTVSSAQNYTYTKGGMILVNVKTNGGNTWSTAVDGVNSLFGGHGTVNYTTSGLSNISSVHKLLGVAESFTGAQSLIYYRADQHTVNGTTYQDANCFHLDEAGVEATNHIWYKDQYGNLIGATNIATVYSYGVIDSIQWVNPQLVTGYAVANLVLMDGTTLNGVTIKAIGDATNAYGVNAEPTTLKYAGFYATTGSATLPSVEGGYVGTTMQENYTAFHGNYLYQIEQDADGGYILKAVASQYVIPANAAGSVTKGGRLGTDVTVNSKWAAVAAGTTGKGADVTATSVIVDSATKYLIQNSTTGVFTTVTGFNNIGTFTNATVDYVDLDGDNRVDYMFIKGEPESAKTSGLFYPTIDTNGNAVYTMDPTTGDYTVYGLVNGVSGSIKVSGKGTSFTLNKINGGTDTYATAAAFVSGLVIHAAQYHGLYDVQIEGGYVIAADAVDGAAAVSLNNIANYRGPYTNMMGIRYNNTVAYYANNVLSVTTTSGSMDYNTTSSTQFFIDGMVYTNATLTDYTVFANHIIHVVYNATGNIATEVYVYSKTTSGRDRKSVV